MKNRKPIVILPDFPGSAEKALAWASSYSTSLFLCYHGSAQEPGAGFDWLLAAGMEEYLVSAPGQAFDRLKEFVGRGDRFVFTALSYDLKNEVENLRSGHPDPVGFPALLVFEPEVLMICRKGEITIESSGPDPDQIRRDIPDCVPSVPNHSVMDIMVWEACMSRQEYLDKVETIRELIREGTVYEANLCLEFHAHREDFDPLGEFLLMNPHFRAPFTAWLKHRDRYLLCYSPERFMCRRGDRIIVQPVKGTAPRSDNAEEDRALARNLYHNEKDRAENVMIVDLMRNDLARSCRPGSIRVDELFGIYSFTRVHQMISSVSGTLKPGLSPVEAVKNAFPMGSMTGAPKVSAMEVIEQLETRKRGLYSGSVGYFAPGGDFDLNVVIRSLQYNARTGYLSVQAGGAITWDSDPECELQEAVLKSALKTIRFPES